LPGIKIAGTLAALSLTQAGPFQFRRFCDNTSIIQEIRRKKTSLQESRLVLIGISLTGSAVMAARVVAIVAGAAISRGLLLRLVMAVLLVAVGRVRGSGNAE
jgi:hypothetical protein